MLLASRFIRRYSSSSVNLPRTANEIRSAFVDYFKQEGHVHAPSRSVLRPMGTKELRRFVDPKDRLFDDFMTDKKNSAIVTHQKCIRASPIDITSNLKHLEQYHEGDHLSFREMLKTFSTDEAFEKEQTCQFSWNFLTEVLGISKDRLYVSYFGGSDEIPVDNETKETWSSIGIHHSRIIPHTEERNDKRKKNMEKNEKPRKIKIEPVHTKIHFETIESRDDATPVINRNKSAVELCDISFTEHNTTTRIETGMCLEHLATVAQGVPTFFDTDLFRPIITELARITSEGVESEWDDEQAEAARVIADRARAVCVAMADGAKPERAPRIFLRKQKDADYLVLNMIRRVKFHSMYVLDSHSMRELIPIVAESLGSIYPELKKRQEEIREIIYDEERRVSHMIINNDRNDYY